MATLNEVDAWLTKSHDLAGTAETRQILTACQRREEIVFAAGLLMTKG
jgi:hypothetical protein